MRTISLGKRGWMALVGIVLVAGAGVWAWQAGYLPEIGRFFAAEPGAPIPIQLNTLMPKTGPVGTWVVAEGENLPVDENGEAKIRFGSGVIQGLSNGSAVAFTIPDEMPIYCPPGAYCILSMLPVQPGEYQVSVENEELCTPPTPRDDGQIVADVAYECGRAQSNPLTFTVTEGPVCKQPPVCVYSDPPCDVPYPDEGWCFPVEGITVSRPSEGGVVDPGDTSYRISWNTDSAYLPSGPVSILLYQYSFGSPGKSLWIARDVPNQGWYNWDTTQTMTNVDNDSSENLRFNPDDSFVINISIPDQGVWGTSGNFSMAGDFPQPTCMPRPSCLDAWPYCYIAEPAEGWCPPYPSTTPPPSAQASLYLNGGATGRVTPGETFRIPVTLDTGGALVTAVKLTAGLSGNAKFIGIAYQPTDFPEILDSGYITDGVVGATVGSGPQGGRTGNLRVFELMVEVSKNAKPGDEIHLSVGPDSQVSATGNSENALRFYGSTYYTVAGSAPLLGDVDFDGDVDIFDYNIVVTNFGRTGRTVSGDADSDGDVDIFDYNLVVTNFGR